MRSLVLLLGVILSSFLSFAQIEGEVRLFVCTVEMEKGHPDTLFIEFSQTANILRMDLSGEMVHDWYILDFSRGKVLSFVRGEVFFSEESDNHHLSMMRMESIREYLIDLLVESSGVADCKVADSPSACMMPANYMQHPFPLDGCYIKD